jgi:hypothetical protein
VETAAPDAVVEENVPFEQEIAEHVVERAVALQPLPVVLKDDVVGDGFLRIAGAVADVEPRTMAAVRPVPARVGGDRPIDLDARALRLEQGSPHVVNHQVDQLSAGPALALNSQPARVRRAP